MIRLFFFILMVAIVAAAAAWFADRPGEMVLVWQGYRIETSLAVALLAVLALVLVLMAVWTGLRLVFNLPAAFSGFLKARRNAKGYAALSRGMIAVGAGDDKQALRAAEQARKILGAEPMTLLLQAQTAQLAGDRKAARRSFEEMLASPETEILGLRGLFVEAQRAGDRDAMKGFAERALRLHPGTGWAATALFDMQCAGSDWDGALATLAANQSNGITGKAEARRKRAVLLTAKAREMENGERDRAEALALEAFNLANDLVPAAALAGRLIAEEGNVRKAARLLEKAWKAFPHPEIAEAYINVRSGDSTRDRLKRMRALAAKLPGEREGALAVAGAAIDARDWQAARAELAPLVSVGPTQRVCELMAEIEEGEHGDSASVHAWLGRAVRALRDPAWTADGVVSEHWAPLSPVTGKLDAFEWKVPVSLSAAPAREAALAHATATKPEVAIVAPAPAQPVEEKPAAPVVDVKVEAAEEALPEKAAKEAKEKEQPPASSNEDKPAGTTGTASGKDDGEAQAAEAAAPGRKPAAKGKPAMVEPTRAPDDPGPEGDGLGDEEGPPVRAI
jgi:HemY protein